MILVLVMTVSTGCPMMASAALQFGPASIVLTTQNAVGFVKEGFLLVRFGKAAVGSRFR